MTDKQIIKVDSLDELYITQLQEQLDQLKAENDLLRKTHKVEQDRRRAYEQVLEDIKKIVETCISGIDCSECPYTEQCRTDIEAEALGVCNLILQKFEGLNE